MSEVKYETPKCPKCGNELKIIFDYQGNRPIVICSHFDCDYKAKCVEVIEQTKVDDNTSTFRDKHKTCIVEVLGSPYRVNVGKRDVYQYAPTIKVSVEILE